MQLPPEAPFHMNIIEIFAIGFGILIGAIVINILANMLGITTWYTFAKNISKQGIKAITETGILSLIFLFIIYPFLLGLIGYSIARLF